MAMFISHASTYVSAPFYAPLMSCKSGGYHHQRRELIKANQTKGTIVKSSTAVKTCKNSQKLYNVISLLVPVLVLTAFWFFILRKSGVKCANAWNG